MNLHLSSLVDEQRIVDNFLSTRTELYNIEPVGIGTPYVESLLSYIARLAEKHNISETVMLKEVFAPVMENENIKIDVSQRGNTYREHLANGISTFSLELISSIEKLTGRKDIQYTTMINWGGLFNENIVNRNRRWCPLCLEMFQQELGIVYEPLLWAISEIKVCDRHQISLKELCPHCGKKMSYIHRNLIVGHCQYCLKWLGESNSNENKILSEDQKNVLKNYKQLFEVSPSLRSFPNKNCISNVLQKLEKQLEFESLLQFSKFLGVNYSGMFYWVKNKRNPSPEKLLHIANKLSCTIYEMISDENLYLKVKVDDFDKSRKVSKITIVEMESYLRDAAYTKSTPKSLAEVCRVGGFSRTAAKNNFPHLSQLILDNFALHRKNSVIQRQKDIEIILKEILTHERPKSLKKSLKDYGLSIRTAQKYHPELCKKIIERHQQFIKIGKEKRIKVIEKEIKTIMLGLHQKGIYPSFSQINKVISDPNIFMERHFRTFRNEMLESLGIKFEG
ncbi:TniQ family protein [Lentibacillus sp. N15]|uniref:TniQ family protein n=1 Tax=Lentibacillus songyuanensis TaxID=3136161 RepID=UPI0031B9F209